MSIGKHNIDDESSCLCAFGRVFERKRGVPAPAMMRILEIPIPLCIAIAMARERF